MVLIQGFFCSLFSSLTLRGIKAPLGVVVIIFLLVFSWGLFLLSYSGKGGVSILTEDEQRCWPCDHRGPDSFVRGDQRSETERQLDRFVAQFRDGQAPVAGVIAGTPKEIRMDEWLVQTPWIWSQLNQHPSFPSTNRNSRQRGRSSFDELARAALDDVFRPQMWGFFLVENERSLSIGTLSGLGSCWAVSCSFGSSLAETTSSHFERHDAPSLLSYVQWFSPDQLHAGNDFDGFLASGRSPHLFRTKSPWAVAGAACRLAHRH